jgi:carboxyl-terminal processing protease
MVISLFAVAMAAVGVSHASGTDETSRARSTSSQVPPGLVERVGQLTEAVLEHHIDPPALQQMILSGMKALYQAAGVSAPAGLSRRVSAVSTPEQLASLVSEVWPKATANPVAAGELEEQFLRGLLASVSGATNLVPEGERKVLEQVEGNRYVGIHIALDMSEAENRPQIADVIEGGPADRAGIKRADLLETINGVDTKGMTLRQAVDRLRGAEGTSVTITVRQQYAAARTYTITRGQHPRPSVKGLRKRSAGGWDVRLSEADPIGYLLVTEMMGSTPHELRMLAQQLESEGTAALVLDLRGLRADSAHTAILLADCLLERGTIGRIRTNRGEMTYQADADAIFRGWPLAVLVDGGTGGAAEWLAAALQDNRRAVIVGAPTASAGRSPSLAVVMSVIPLGESEWSVSLATGILERGDGSPLSRFDNPPSAAFRKPDRNRFGVHPDHVVAGSEFDRRARLATANGAEHAWTKPDAAQQKALELLRQRLKKS